MQTQTVARFGSAFPTSPPTLRTGTPCCSLASSTPFATKQQITSKMPSPSRLPSSELSLSRRVPAEGGPSSHSCSLSPVPALGRATIPILGSLSPFATAGSRQAHSCRKPAGTRLEHADWSRPWLCGAAPPSVPSPPSPGHAWQSCALHSEAVGCARVYTSIQAQEVGRNKVGARRSEPTLALGRSPSLRAPRSP